MGLLSIKGKDLIEWVPIEFVLILLLGIVAMINLFILSHRLNHLEKHKIFDLERCHRDFELLNRLRDLQTVDSNKEPFDEQAFGSFINLNGGKSLSPDNF
jgi:hypothetical protein